jgi:DNA-binding GntR family transcriptional regulator
MSTAPRKKPQTVHGAAPRTIPVPPRSPDLIADRIVDAILAGRIAAGQRLGEQSLATLFGVSRTLVREGLSRLSARGMVEVSSRRGWYVVQPSRAEAREAFDARLAIETGLAHTLPERLPPAALKRLKQHVAQERAAIRAGDPGERSYLLGDFHVCLAECAGNSLLADILKDLTARTTLVATLFQSTHDAARSCAEHAQIVAALEAGDRKLAVQRIRAHIESVADHLGAEAVADDPLAPLRSALAPPPAKAPAATPTAAGGAPKRRPRKLFTGLEGLS